MNIFISLLFQILTPLLIILFIATLIVVISSRFFRRPGEYISLWLTLAMVCLVGLQAAFTYQQFQASERPSIGINLESINFLKNTQDYQDVINVNGNILSKFLSPLIMIVNHGEKPGFVEMVSIDFEHGNEHLSLTSPDWENLPLYPKQKMELTLKRPISNDDFNRIGFTQNEVKILIGATYRNMAPLGDRYKITAEYKYQAANEKLRLINSKFSYKYGAIDWLKNKVKKYIQKGAFPMKPTIIGLIFQLLGTICLISKPAFKYFRGYLLRSRIIRKEIEDEAIGTTFNRLADDDRSKNLSDSLARGFITTYKNTFWGFIFIVIGFIIQILAK